MADMIHELPMIRLKIVFTLPMSYRLRLNGTCVVNYVPEFCWERKNLSCFKLSGTLAPWNTVCSPKAIETSSIGVTTPLAVSSSDPQQWAAVIIQRSLKNFITLLPNNNDGYVTNLRTVPPQTNPVFCPLFCMSTILSYNVCYDTFDPKTFLANLILPYKKRCSHLWRSPKIKLE